MKPEVARVILRLEGWEAYSRGKSSIPYYIAKKHTIVFGEPGFDVLHCSGSEDGHWGQPRSLQEISDDVILEYYDYTRRLNL